MSMEGGRSIRIRLKTWFYLIATTATKPTLFSNIGAVWTYLLLNMLLINWLSSGILDVSELMWWIRGSLSVHAQPHVACKERATETRTDFRIGKVNHLQGSFWSQGCWPLGESSTNRNSESSLYAQRTIPLDTQPDYLLRGITRY